MNETSVGSTRKSVRILSESATCFLRRLGLKVQLLIRPKVAMRGELRQFRS